MNSPVAAHHLLPATPRAVPAAFLEALVARFGAQCSQSLAVREQHGRDEGALQAPPPSAVVFAESTQDVSDAVKLASDYEVPIIAYGAGSSIEGHLLAVQGGISLDVSRMNRVLSVNADDLTVTVQPGLSRKQLNEAIRDTGLFFPIDPGADASLGGRKVLDGADVQVEYGQLVALVGPNGAGKSCLIKAFVGLLDLDGGVARLNGGDVRTLSPRERA